MKQVQRLAIATGLAFCAWGAAWAQNGPRVAVTDLAYTQAVAQYFEAGTYKSSGTVSAHSGMYSGSMSASHQSSGTYVAGSYSYMEQRELGSFSSDIRGLLLKGGQFRVVQGKRFDAGDPQPTKAEQVLNQLQTGKMAKPVRQPEVKDIIARIKKGEFPGADYVLFGTLTSMEFRDSLSPLQGTTTTSHQFTLDLVADFSLINTKTYEIKASFSAQGAGNDTKLLSVRGDVQPPNRGKVIRETSKSLSVSVYEQLADQLGLLAQDLGGSSQDVPPPRRPAQQNVESTTILR